MSAEASRPLLFPGTAQQRRAGVVVLATIVVIAAVLRFWNIGAENLWLDEVYTLQFSTGRGSVDFNLPRNTIIAEPPRPTSLDGAPPAWAVWTSLKDDTHPPLYYLMVRGWRVVFGDSPLALRSLSGILSVVAVAIVFLIGWAHFGRMATGAWAAALMTIAVPQITYGQEGRDYALLVATTALAVFSVIWIERSGASLSRLAFLIASLLLAMLTHYYCIGVIAALGLYALIRFRGQLLWRSLAAMFIAGTIYLLIWGPFLWQQRTTFSTMNPRPDDAVDHVARSIARLLELPILHLIGRPVENGLAVGALVLAVLVITTMVQFRRRELLLPWLWMGATVGVVLAVDLMNTSRQLGFVRYSLAAAPALFLLIGDGLGMKKIARHFVPAIALTTTLLFLPIAYSPWRADGTPMARYLDESARPGDVVVFYGGERGGRSAAWVWLVLSHYREKSNPIVILDGPIPSSLLDQLKRSPTVFLATDTFPILPDDILPRARVVESKEVRGFGTVSKLQISRD